MIGPANDVPALSVGAVTTTLATMPNSVTDRCGAVPGAIVYVDVFVATLLLLASSRSN